MRPPLRLVIFDCDGVLVDSEGVANRIVAAELTALGWPMTGAESQSRFMGMTLTDMRPVIEARLGPLPADWAARLARRLVTALAEEARPMPGAEAVLRATSAMGLPWRVASNSSRAEMAAKFARCGLTALVGGRVHSAGDVSRGKPHPDVFLAAAAAAGVEPAACLVVEDSLPGVRGALAAGMEVLGFAPHDDGEALEALGARPVHALADVPALLRARMAAAA